MAKAKKEVQPKEKAKAKTFIKCIALPGLPVAYPGDEVKGDYIKAVANLSKEDQAKYVG
jgi:hypothetical protein